MKIKDSVQQMTLDLFQNCDVPEDDDFVGTTNGFIPFAVIRREKI